MVSELIGIFEKYGYTKITNDQYIFLTDGKRNVTIDTFNDNVKIDDYDFVWVYDAMLPRIDDYLKREHRLLKIKSLLSK